MGKVRTASHREKASGRSARLDGKFLSCNLSHWKPQARFLVRDVMSAGSGAASSGRETRVGGKRKGTLFPSPSSVHTSSVHRFNLPLSGGSMMSWEEQKPPPGSTAAALTSWLHFPHGQRGGRGIKPGVALQCGHCSSVKVTSSQR